MKPRYKLEDVSYNMFMRGGGDVWGIFGRCAARGIEGRFMISTPIAFDKRAMTVESNNTIYHIRSWGSNTGKYIEDLFWEQVAKDTIHGYEIH